MDIYSTTEGNSLSKLMHSDIETYLVELLMKQDQMSMAASIESRVPFLDHRFVEYAVRIPDRFKIRLWRTKAVLREALRDLVPKEILSRRKMGFPVPVGDWLRTTHWPIVEDFVISRRALERGWFDPDVVRQLAEDHRSGKENHGQRLWLLIGLEIWQRIHIDGEPALAVGECVEAAA
jgi:asparagine synthase (glutamine-hydrolysing)